MKRLARSLPCMKQGCIDEVVFIALNNGTPKSSILIGFSIINHPFGVPLFLETPILVCCKTPLSLFPSLFPIRFLWASVYLQRPKEHSSVLWIRWLLSRARGFFQKPWDVCGCIRVSPKSNPCNKPRVVEKCYRIQNSFKKLGNTGSPAYT